MRVSKRKTASFAYAILAAALLTGACSSSKTDVDTELNDKASQANKAKSSVSDEPTQETTKPAESTALDPNAEGVDYSRPSDEVQIGSGRIMYISPDMASIGISDLENPIVQDGCEGFPDPVIRLIDIESGALSDAVVNQPGAFGLLQIDSSNRGVLSEGCEGYLSSIKRFVMNDDGTIQITDDLSHLLEQDLGEVAMPALGVDDNLLIAASVYDSETDNSTLDVLELKNDELTKLFTLDSQTPYVSPMELDDNTIGLLIDGNLDIYSRDGVRKARYAADWATISPDHKLIATTFEGKIDIIDHDSSTRLVTLEGQNIYNLVWSPDASAIAFATSIDVDETLNIVDLTTKEVTVITQVALLDGFAFSPDSTMLAFGWIPNLDDEITNPIVSYVTFDPK